MVAPAESISISGDVDPDLPLIPEGEYTVTYVRHKSFFLFGRHSCAVTFRIVDHGPYFETELPRYYNCRRGSDRSVTAPPKSNLYREFCTVVGRKPDRRRIPVSQFKGVLLKARIKTVMKDNQQDELPEPARYSKIDKILRRAET
jgi:hypothetical protein